MCLLLGRLSLDVTVNSISVCRAILEDNRALATYALFLQKGVADRPLVAENDCGERDGLFDNEHKNVVCRNGSQADISVGSIRKAP